MPELTDEKRETARRLTREGVIEVAGPDESDAFVSAINFGNLVRHTCIVSQQVIRDMGRVH